MGKLKKNKETVKTIKSEKTKISKKVSLKPKKVVKDKKIKQLAKEIKVKKIKISAPIDEEQIRKGIEALIQFEEQKLNKDLFTRELPIFLQIDSIRIPKCPDRNIKLPLKHTLLSDKQEVCLIVPDLKKGRRIDHEPTIEHYEDLLRSKNVKSIKRIIPIRQLRVEYDQFELKRRLCGYYDYFLVAGNISGHVLHLLGKTFISKRKNPVPIKLETNDLNLAIENALKKSILNIHSQGPTFIVQFGHTEMTTEQLTENLKVIADKLVTDFPGGWLNIRSLHIKTDKSISIPIYYTLKSANKVNVPVIKPIRPKHYEKVTGEVTTKPGNSEVIVHPGGRIQFKTKQHGISKNQIRKKNQAKIKIKSAALKAKREKLANKKVKANTDKIKTDVKEENIKIQSKNKVAVKQKKVKKEKTKQDNPTPGQVKNTKKSNGNKQETPEKKQKSKKLSKTQSPGTETLKIKKNKQQKLKKRITNNS